MNNVLKDWDGYWDDRVSEVEVDLIEELERRQAAGEAASEALAALWMQSRSLIDADEVSAIRTRFPEQTRIKNFLVLWRKLPAATTPRDPAGGREVSPLRPPR